LAKGGDDMAVSTFEAAKKICHLGGWAGSLAVFIPELILIVIMARRFGAPRHHARFG